MDANLAQSVVVWAALSIGLASVLYCMLSSVAPAEEAESEPSESKNEPAAVLDTDRVR